MGYKLLRVETILGIGIGFILSAALVGFFSPEKTVSDKEIIIEAKKLGMVTREEYEIALQGKNVTSEQKADVSTSFNKEQPSQQVNREAVNNLKDKPQELQAPKLVKIHIPKGSNSFKIAKILLEAGVITDVELFNKAVDDLKVQRKFQRGDFNVPAGGTMEEIIDILTHQPNA